MSERPYLSIGEVLGLLLEEFPDVTISKIRFLESQGLIDPERTPSGYRKFYDHDVERLRVILREQRENYLPLRVIRDRLERGDIESDPSSPQPAPRGVRNVEVPAARLAAHPASSAPLVGVAPPIPTGASPSTAVDNGTPTPPAADGPRQRVEPAPADAGAPAGAKAVDPAPLPAHIATPATSVRSTPQPEPRRGATSSSRTREELCAIAGVTVEQLSELESFGLIAGRGNGPATMYGEDACEIAALASQFLARGIEARHLRAWKTSADREAGLFEQRILPLLRQRNPQARQQALATLQEFADLGGRMRAAMVRAALRHHLD